MKRIGKTEKGKLYHIRNIMESNGHFSLCGEYMPEDKLEDNLDAFELKKEKKICEKCMHSSYFKQSRD